MKKSLLILTALAAGGAFADTYWTGRTLSDWSDDGAWTGSWADGDCPRVVVRS